MGDTVWTALVEQHAVCWGLDEADAQDPGRREFGKRDGVLGGANRSVTFILSERPAADALEMIVGQQGEELRLGTREIYVHYDDGIGCSKLHIPAAENGTARNMNTVMKLAHMAAGSPER